jgi:putative GTP pyrophosphokinase
MSLLDAKILEFKDHYDSNLTFYNSALSYFIKLIGKVDGIEYISGRVKEYEECLSKFERKYLPEISSADTDYHIIDSLSDFIGIRVVCFYLEDVKKIRKEFGKYFRELSSTDKAVMLETTDDKFGYKSLHLDLVLKRNNKIRDYKKYGSIQIEVQIRTVIQDAWSILDHKIKYKKSIPQYLKRRINRLSALFEIADDEFLRIKEEIALEEYKISERIKKGAPIAKDVPLDVFKFLFLALKYFPHYNFIEFKVDGFVQEILHQKKDFSESDLNDVLLTHLDAVDQMQANNAKKKLNPYTKIRYCLYLSNRDTFSGMLNSYQIHFLENNN